MASPSKRIKLSDDEKEMKKSINKMFSPGFVFPQQETDDNLMVEISNYVSFGDLKDSSCVEPQNCELEGGTIMGHISTVRRFHPGQYKVTVIKPINEGDPLVMFHHADVDPNLLALQVVRLCEDYEEYHYGLRSAINRYDWTQWNHFDRPLEEEEERGCDFWKADNIVSSLLEKDFKSQAASSVPLPDCYESGIYRANIYFTQTEKSSELKDFILRNQVRRSSAIKQVFSVQDDDGNTVSIGINFMPFNTGEWEYAKAFEDTETRSYFALILNGYLNMKETAWYMMFTDKEKKKIGFTTIDKTELKFPMSTFLRVAAE